MELALTQDEVELLKSMVEKDIHELLMEIANADVREFRQELKRKEDILVSVRAKLAEGTTA